MAYAADCNPFIQGMVTGLAVADLGSFKVSMEVYKYMLINILNHHLWQSISLVK